MLEDLSSTLHPNHKICVACDITLPTEIIITKTAQYWRNNPVDLHKKPTIFVYTKIKKGELNSTPFFQH